MIRRLSDLLKRIIKSCSAYILIMPDDVLIVEKEC